MQSEETNRSASGGEDGDEVEILSRNNGNYREVALLLGFSARAIMELRQSLCELASVRALCLPMGAISAVRFEYYLAALRRQVPSVQLDSLNLALDRDSALSYYMSQSWTSAIRFSYLSEPMFDAPNSVHLTRHYLLVIGVTEQSRNVFSLYRELETLVQELNHVLVWKLFSFEPESSDSELEITAPNLINFYPNQDEAHFLANLETVMHDLSFFLVVAAARSMRDIRDSPYDIRLPEDDDSKLRKRREGRVEKLCGDLCAIVGIRSDAEFHYKKAYELQKNNSDYAWMGGTMECLGALELISEQNKSVNGLLFSDWVLSKLKEALYFYTKGKELLLYAEGAMRMSRYLFETGRKREALESLMKTLEWTLVELPLSDKVAWVQEAGGLCIGFGYARKGAFLLRMAAKLSIELGNYTNAYQLLYRTASYYHLSLIDGNCAYEKPVNSSSPKFNRELLRVKERMEPWTRLPAPRGWTVLQHEVLKELIMAARGCGDIHSEVLCLAVQLQLLHDTFPPEKLSYLRAEFETKASNVGLGTNLPLVLYPLLLKFEPIKSRHEIMKVDPESSSLFLFSPWEKDKSQKELNWTDGSIQSVNVHTVNLFPFDIVIDAANLLINGRADCLPRSSHAVTFTIKAKSRYTTHLYVMPHGVGPLTIKGAMMSIFGITTTHLCPPVTVDIGQMIPELKV